MRAQPEQTGRLPHGLQALLPDAADPDVARVRAVVESRLLGDAEQTARIGRFTVLERVAEGGMGVVFAAYDTELDRKVALKLLRADRDDDIVRRRIVREARAMAKLSHPNVAQVYEVGEHAGRTFIAMELVAGRTLRAWLDERPRGWREALDVYAQAGRGLAGAHAAGLVHRDFKPDNALIGDDGRVRVLDFGLARTDAPESTQELPTPTRSADVLATPLTITGALVGTPAYMSPEQFNGNEVDAQTDQFAFCVALWEALYRQAPFAGRSSAELADDVTHARIREPPSGTPTPRWLCAVLARGLAAEPKARWPSMEALLVALHRGQRRARLRRLGFGCLALVVVAAAAEGWRRYDVAQRSAACAAEGERIAEVWNDDARTQMHDALLATGAPYAASTVELVTPWLDDYASGWAATRTQACLDATVHARIDADLLDRSRWCLDEARLDFEKTVGQLRAAEENAVLSAVRWASGLPAVAPCGDRDRLQTLLAPAPDQREGVRAIRAELARATSLARDGKVDEAYAVVEAAVDSGRDLGWAPIESAARRYLAGRYASSGRLKEAEQVLGDAYYRAAEAGASEAAMDAARQLSNLLAEQGGRPSEGLHWARLAEVEDLRTGERDPMRTSDRLNSLGLVQVAAGLHAEARASHERALTLDEAALGSNHPDLFSTLNNLANACMTLGDYPRARELYERALVLAETALGPDHPDVAVAVDNLSIVYDDTGDYAQAIELQRRGLAIREVAFGPDHFMVSLSLTNLGAAYGAVGEYAEARTVLERALAIRERVLGPDHPRVAIVLNNLGDVYQITGAYAEAEALFRRALAIFEKVQNPDHPHVAQALYAVAGTRAAVGDLETALTMHQRALTIREKVFGPRHVEVGRSLSALASVHLRQRETAEARRLYEQAREVLTAAVGPEHDDVVDTLRGLAEVHRATGQLETAYELQQHARDITQRTLGPSHPSLARILTDLGRIELERGRASEAVEPLERAMRLHARTSRPPIERARTGCALARALWDADDDRGRARTLAREALAAYLEAGPLHVDAARECEGWLAKRAGL